MTKSQLQIGCLVANCVGGRIGPGYQAEVERFLRTNGNEWTARRYKAIWNAALHLRNGDKAQAQSIYRRYSIAYRKGDCTPRGHCGAAVRSFLSADKPAAIRRWSALLRYYTGIQNRRASKSQTNGMVKNISSPSALSPKGVLIMNSFEEFSGEKFRRVAGAIRKRIKPAFITDVKGSVSYYSPMALPRVVRDDYYGPLIHSLMTTRYVPLSLRRTLGHFFRPDRAQDRTRQYFGGSFGRDPAVGWINLFQEGGTKLRAVATPNAWVQLAFKPLDRALRFITDGMETSCIRNQLSGVQVAINALEHGLQVDSIDLSAATDRLPRSLQTKILDWLGLPEFSVALDEVSSEKWIIRERGYESQSVSYTTGQPMGLYGSYSLLDITNNEICRMCLTNTGEDRTGSYRTLGDDVIFINAPNSSEQYREIMFALGVEISNEKSFSGQVVQFAGFNILPSKDGPVAYRPYKHSDCSYVNNPIDFLANLGKGVRNLKDPRWASRFEAFQKTAKWRRLDNTPDLWVKDDSDLGPYRHVDRSWIGTIMNKLITAYQEFGPVEEVATFPPGLILGSVTSPQEEGSRPDFSIPHTPSRGENRERESEDSKVRVRISNDPLMSLGDKPKDAPYQTGGTLSEESPVRISRDSVVARPKPVSKRRHDER